METAMNPADAEQFIAAAGPPAPWFVGFTKPREERRAVENLCRQGFDCHLPVIQVPRRARGEIVWQTEAMFSRYLFLKPSPGSAPLERVRSTLGMSGLVRFAGLPATVSEGIVKGLMALGDSRREAMFQPGEGVRFVEGPLAGLEGVFERVEGEVRAVVMLDFLQRQQRVTVPAHMLAGAH